ncbi:hypothetical protein [Magnetospirillum molischianum]|uniref:Uncharacterized protein n=1 Tax=Magnetospirillum molischianum DSM 120 TaxID=1150626 RepID=H8FNX5_MAGML|nr:hypothetical protein [Magnetospirillum molischianum]CCG40063.1 conserved exported hypothetical protein [Magnetospirillum molischianum DSM 120]
MLGKMILQGLGAAAIVATAASVYSASAQTGSGAAPATIQSAPLASVDTGYLPADRGGKASDQTKSRRSHHDDDDDDDDHHGRHHDRRDSGDRDGRK